MNWLKEAKSNNPFKPGDKVRYKDGDTTVYTVIGVYSDEKVSLSLADYPDTEQDSLTNINRIEKVQQEKEAAKKEPSPETLDRWMADGYCYCPDGCKVEPDGKCPHGQDSWAVIMGVI